MDMKRIRRGIDTDFSLRTIDQISTESAQDESMVELAYSLVGENDHETFLNIFHHTRADVQYVNDGSTGEGEDEWLRTAQRTLIDKIGDCDDRTTLHSTYLKILGIPHLYRVVAYEEEGAWQHIYVVAYDRQNGEWVSLDTVPEVPYALAEIPFLDVKQPEYEPQMPNTYLLRGAPENASDLQKLNALVAEAFGGELRADDIISPKDLNEVFATELLERLKEQIEASEQTNRTRYEASILQDLLSVADDQDDFAMALQNVVNFDNGEESMFEPIYAQLLYNLVNQPAENISVAEYIAYNKSLLPAEAKSLGFVGAIVGAGANLVGQFKASSDAKKERAFQENMATKTAEENAKNREEAEKQRQFELEKARLEQQTAMLKQQNAPATQSTGDATSEKKGWYAKNWWWVILIIVLTGGIAAFFIFKKSDNAMQGAKKAKKPKRRKPLGRVTGAGVKRPTLQKPALPKPKPRPNKPAPKPKPKPRVGAPSRPKKNNRDTKKNKTAKTAKRKAQKKANQKRRTNSKKRK